MTTLLMCGDVHGDIEHLMYLASVARRENVNGIVALGDFGFRFTTQFVDTCRWVTEDTGVPLWWICGNHDSHEFINGRLDELESDRQTPLPLWEDAPNVLYIPRGATFDIAGRRFMGLGGAHSTDQHTRAPGVGWWDGETLSYRDVDRAVFAGPVDVMFTHDAPYGVNPLEETLRLDNERQDRASATNRKAVAAVVEACRPRLLIHGHYHRRYDGGITINGHTTAVSGLDRNTTGPLSWETLTWL